MILLPSEITHSLSFLSSNILDMERILDLYQKGCSKIDSIDNDEDGAPGLIRKASNKYSDKMNDVNELVIIDYKLFIEEIDDIYKNRHSDDVIMYLRKYKEYYKKYEDFQEKKFNKVYEKYDDKKDECEHDQDYVKLIAYNKLFIRLEKSNKMLDTIVKKLKKFD